MGDWKEKLKKLIPELAQIEHSKSTGEIIRGQPTDSVPDVMKWKKGVKPLEIPPGKVMTKFPRTRKVSGKQKSKKNKESLPSTAATQATYYGTVKTTPTRPKQKQPDALVPPGYRDLPQVILAKSSEFKEPDTWVKAGTALQATADAEGRVLPIIMGIDFGTAYTKVALRVADQVFFIDWDGVRSSAQRYFLPGELSCLRDGRTRLGRPLHAAETHGRLKLPILLADGLGSEKSAPTVVFLAWVMCYARAWLYHHHASLVWNRRLAWEVNMGCPTGPSFSQEVTRHYKHIGSCAWNLSQYTRDISLAEAHVVIRDPSLTPETIGLDGLFLVQEFLAQIAGYLKSPQGREDGLHLLVDVGAGTLDIAVFNVFRPHMDDPSDVRVPIFAGAMPLLGTHILMATRLRDSKMGIRPWNDLDGLPGVEQISREFGIDLDTLARLDGQFEALIRQRIARIIGFTRTSRYPQAPEWKRGMRVFLTGGGSACEVYRQGVENSFKSFGTPPLFTQFPMLEAAAKRIGKQNFHRVSVAFGLTYDAESIGKTVQPKDIEDVSPTVPVTRPDRDDLYPK